MSVWISKGVKGPSLLSGFTLSPSASSSPLSSCLSPYFFIQSTPAAVKGQQRKVLNSTCINLSDNELMLIGPTA